MKEVHEFEHGVLYLLDFCQSYIDHHVVAKYNKNTLLFEFINIDGSIYCERSNKQTVEYSADEMSKYDYPATEEITSFKVYKLLDIIWSRRFNQAIPLIFDLD